MATYVNKNTDFNDVIISNDYPCLVGGNWTAKRVYVSNAYKTVYTDGTTTYDGPVNLIGANLTIAANAKVDNLVSIGTIDNPHPTITVQTGGTLQNSTIFNSSVTIKSSGLSTNNSYISSQVWMSGGWVNSTTPTEAKSTGDYFYSTAATSDTSGHLYLSQLGKDQSTFFQTSTDSASLTSAPKSYSNVIAGQKIVELGGKKITVELTQSSSIGTSTVDQSKLSQYGYNPSTGQAGTGLYLNSDQRRVIDGSYTQSYTATVVDGKTVIQYYAGSYLITVPFPCVLLNVLNFTVSAGAVVDGVTIVTAPKNGTLDAKKTTITIQAGGTLQNSFIGDEILNNYGTSKSNTILGTRYTGQPGSTSSNDLIVIGYLTNATLYNPDAVYNKTIVQINTPDGVFTESYLDTGNRSNFNSQHNIVSLVNRKQEWNIHSAAPLATQRDIVEPIYMALTQRAMELGFEFAEKNHYVTNDSHLHLVTDTGEIIHASSQNNGQFIFKLPENVMRIHLNSLTSRPSQVIGCYIDDRRDLGVLVGKVNLIEKTETISITQHCSSKSLKGWDVQEPAAHRWTNGNAALNVRSQPSDTASILVVEVLAGGPYIVQKNKLHQSAA